MAFKKNKIDTNKGEPLLQGKRKDKEDQKTHEAVMAFFLQMSQTAPPF
jgi:hypothetical protein